MSSRLKERERESVLYIEAKCLPRREKIFISSRNGKSFSREKKKRDDDQEEEEDKETPTLRGGI